MAVDINLAIIGIFGFAILAEMGCRGLTFSLGGISEPGSQ